MSADTGQVLRTAAQHVRQHGWRTETFGDRHGGLCLHGGIYSALLDHNDISYVERSNSDFGVWDMIRQTDSVTYGKVLRQSGEATDALSKVIPDGCSCEDRSDEDASGLAWVYHYNDVHCTGGEDAALLLEQAAEKWEADR